MRLKIKGIVISAIAVLCAGLYYATSGKLHSQNSRERGVHFLILHSFGYSDPWFKHHFIKPQGRVARVNKVLESSYGLSAHYIVSQESKKVWQILPDGRVSYHAGKSDWKGLANTLGGTGLNDLSIGIEFQILGYMQPFDETYRNPNAPYYFPVEGRQLAPFYFPKFDASILGLSINLCVGLVKKWRIPAEHVLPHSSIAPGRKTDPGPYFPYEEFARAGVGVWADEDREGDKPLDLSLEHVQSLLKKWGYPGVEVTNVFDEGTKAALHAHYMHHLANEVDWSRFIDREEGTIFDHLEKWEEMPYEKKKLVINLENLVAGRYKYEPLYSLRR